MALPQDAVAPNTHRISLLETEPEDMPPRRFVPPAALRRNVHADVHGYSRVANAAEYRLYADDGADPVPGTSTVRAAGAALPLAWTSGDGDWHVGVTYFNGFIESDMVRVDRLIVTAGVLEATKPSNPNPDWFLRQDAAGVVSIHALYFGRPDGANIADRWQIWYTTDGSTPDPDVDPADATVAMAFVNADQDIALLDYNIPAQSHGTTIKAIIRTYRLADTVASDNTAVKTTTADATGPAAPADLQGWRGAVPEA